MNNQSMGNGALIGMTAIIWAFATGMLAICIPLVSMTKSGLILPLTVITGSTIATVVVWMSNFNRLSLRNTIKSLEERINNLETNTTKS
ncbi:hypothetical protein [Gloeocapsa sp. PCC 73106]|uniref:hypothetical protein n=1 Tax=Gloeocapsa sp. PCC 73106 TaxID=102232 RepID=UPI0002AC649A|nr:hypothetical protein [Gloeocapsa sp. PCC 73106]ELR97589.1 hypothetical protein GLO73106DRAFT_00013990 [Gloeocapsa sp. PCC 73106]